MYLRAFGSVGDAQAFLRTLTDRNFIDMQQYDAEILIWYRGTP